MSSRRGEKCRFANTTAERQTEVDLVRDYYSEQSLFEWWTRHPYRRDMVAKYSPYLAGLESELGRTLTIVEVGSAVGADVTLLAERFPTAKVIGFDLSPEGVLTSARLAAGEFFVSDAERPALVDNCCDVVLIVNVLHHFYRYPDQVLDEINRILRPGGLMFLKDPNAGKITPRLVVNITSRAMRFVHWWTRTLRRPMFDMEIPPASPTERGMRYEEVRDLLGARFDLVDRRFVDGLTHMARWHAFPQWPLRLLDKAIHFVDPRSLVFYSFVCRSRKPRAELSSWWQCDPSQTSSSRSSD